MDSSNPIVKIAHDAIVENDQALASLERDREDNQYDANNLEGYAMLKKLKKILLQLFQSKLLRNLMVNSEQS